MARHRRVARSTQYSAIRHAERLRYFREYNAQRKFHLTGRRRKAFAPPSATHVSRAIHSSFRSMKPTWNGIHGGPRVRDHHSKFDNMRLSISLRKRQLSLKSTASINLAERRRTQQVSGRRLRKGS